MNSSRRSFIRKVALVTAATGMSFSCSGGKQTPAAEVIAGSKKIRRNKIGVSTYSFWQFNGPKENSPIEDCIEKAAEMGFDGIEFLLMQMQSEENSYLQRLKRQSFHAGLDIMGFSTHQGFVYPDKKSQGFRSCKNHPPNRACLSAGNSNHAVEYRQVEHNKIV